MAARRPFWKWHRWKSIGFCLWPPSTCIWNLKLKFQSKLDLCSGNHVVYRQTDRRTDGRTDKVNPVYPPSNFVGRGYNKDLFLVPCLVSRVSATHLKIFKWILLNWQGRIVVPVNARRSNISCMTCRRILVPWARPDTPPAQWKTRIVFLSLGCVAILGGIINVCRGFVPKIQGIKHTFSVFFVQFILLCVCLLGMFSFRCYLTIQTSVKWTSLLKPSVNLKWFLSNCEDTHSNWNAI